jgi:hypothetical protein
MQPYLADVNNSVYSSWDKGHIINYFAENRRTAVYIAYPSRESLSFYDGLAVMESESIGYYNGSNIYVYVTMEDLYHVVNGYAPVNGSLYHKLINNSPLDTYSIVYKSNHSWLLLN